jgi:hypothetical protein
MDIIGITQESYDFTDDNGAPYPALKTRGRSCCSTSLPITQENLEEARNQAREWLSELEAMEPFNYPPDVEIIRA